MGHVTENVVQQAFRARNDDGSETSATWKSPLNSDIGMSLDVPFRVRFLIEETAGGSANNYSYVLQYSLNGGAWTLATLSTPVHATPSAFVANATPTTQQIGAGSFVAGLFDSNADVSNISISSQQTEMEYCLLLDSSQMSGGDTVQLRVTNGGTPINGYTHTPAISVATIGNIAATLDDTTASASGQLVPVATVSATLADTTATATGFHPGPDYAEPYYVEDYYAPTTAESTAPSGDLSATLDDTTADVQATRFPAYWVKIAGAVTIQAGEESFHAILQVDASNNGGWWFDEVRATVNGGANQLTNGLFETGDKTGWTGNAEQDGVVVATESLFEPPGVYTLQLEADPTLPQLQSSDSFPVTEGDQVYVEAWAYFYGGVNSKGKATGRTKNASGDTVRTVVVAESSPTPGVVTGELAAGIGDTVAAVDGHHDPLHEATIAATLEDTTASVAAVQVVQGTLSAELDGTTVVAQAEHGVVGQATAQLDDSAAGMAGVHGATGTATVAIDATTADASGAHGVVGDLSAAISDTQASLSATFGDEPVATIDATLDDVGAVVLGDVGVRATVTAQTDDTQAVVSGVHGVVGTKTASLENTAASLTGEHLVAGDLSATLADTGLSATGSQAVVGSLGIATEDTVAAVEARYGDAPTGDLAAILEDAQAQAAGAHGVAGTVEAALAGTQAQADAAHGAAGDVSAELEGTSAGVTGEHLVAGSLAALLEGTEAAVSGEFEQPGQSVLAAQLDDTQSAVQAAHGVAGTLHTSAGDLSLEITASSGVAGTATASLGDTTAAVIAEYEDSSRTVTVGAQLDDTQATVSAEHFAPVEATVVATADATQAAITATFTQAAAGTVQTTLDDVGAALTTVHGVVGVYAVPLDGISAVFTFKSGSIGAPENPGVMDTSSIPGLRDLPVQAGVRNTSNAVGVSITGREPGVR